MIKIQPNYFARNYLIATGTLNLFSYNKLIKLWLILGDIFQFALIHTVCAIQVDCHRSQTTCHFALFTAPQFYSWINPTQFI